MSRLHKQKMFPNNNKFLNNYFNDDFQKIIQPIHFLQCMYCVPKFHIKDNFLRAVNSFFLKLFWPILFSLMSFIIVFRAVTNMHISRMFLCLGIYETISSFIGFYINWKVNIINSKENVKFLIKLQRFMNFDVNKRKILKKITFINWVVVIMIFFFHFFSIFCEAVIDYKNIINLLCIYCYGSLDIHAIYATQMILLIRLNLESFMAHMNAYKYKFGTKRFIRNKCRYLQWEAEFKRYLQLLELYEINRKIFEDLVRKFYILNMERKFYLFHLLLLYL